jgi:D-serine deaminase-like pyridoxal phosphate-dependent protein
MRISGGYSALPERRGLSRRAALWGAGALALAGGGVMAARKPDRGGGHNAYFLKLSQALAAAGCARPTLVVDRARLDANIAAARQTLASSRLPVRVVVKSLPAHGLIDAVAAGMATDRFMVFNGPMTIEMAQRRPRADLLLGKPLAAAETARVMDAIGAVAPQWLIDTPARLAQYAELAKARGVQLRANFEIDVGLHRGGFATPQALAEAIDAALAGGVAVTGLMGYDPHVPKTPDPKRAYAASQKAYAACMSVLLEKLAVDPAALTLNSAGSPTYALHAEGTVANEVAVGSAFVKPTDFDLPTLERHTPAAFIATPVLKALARAETPSLEAASGLFAFFDPNTKRAYFIHGGHWLAKPESPPGLQYSALFGRSSNQELLTGSDATDLKPDDHVFLRPTQSEAVFLQFGDIAVFDGEKIAGFWPTFPVSA